MMKKINLLRFMVVAALVGVVLGPISAQEEDDEMYGDRPTKSAAAKKRYEADLKLHKGNSDILVLPGLIADRKKKQVDTLCETTPLSARGSAEYIIISEGSSHGYEAMLWSFATPGNLHKALEFIGMDAGSPADPRQLRFWSKGERAIASVVMGEDIVRLEKLIFDEDTKDTLPEEGFIFTGSMFIDNPTGGTERVYLADAYDPKSIIAAYNEPASVFDPPWRATKGEFYDSHVASPEFDIGAHELVTVRYEPEYKDGRSRVYNLNMEIGADKKILLKDAKTGKQISEKPTFDSAIRACKKIIEERREPYVTVSFDETMKLNEIKQICTMLFMMDLQNGLRIDPPTAGKLYYRAFMPNPQWIDPKGRMMQPWELHLTTKDDKTSGFLVIYDAEWKRNQSRPDLTKRSYEVSSAADIQKRMEKESEERKEASRRAVPAALLIFTPETIAYGELMKFLPKPVTANYSIHLFFDEKNAVEEEKEGKEDDKAKKAEKPEEAEKDES